MPDQDRSIVPDTARFRTDIEGLRGLAVLLVVAYHAFGAPLGGFVGVDVFFVISGYLITGILLRERARTGRISITGFYARRARRILPAALVTIVTTVVAAVVVWYPVRAWSVGLDGVWSALFVENWHLIAVGTDYLHAADPASPLQHFWSLAVEEQFYAVWPVVVILLTALPWRRRLVGRRAVLAAAIVLTVGSVGLAVVESSLSPGSAYFDTLSRGWELGAGALLAIGGPLLRRSGGAVHTVLFVAGVVMILVGAVCTTGSSLFPWPLAVVPVVGTVLVLASGDRASGTVTAALTNPQLRWFGRISYSLYLWHFPVVIVGSAVTGGGPIAAIGAVVIAIVLAVLSERWIERPFLARRRGTPPADASSSGGSAAQAAGRRQRRHRITDAAVATVVLVALVALSASQIRGPAALKPPTAFGVGASAASDDGASGGRAPAPPIPAADLGGIVDTAARSSDWEGDPARLLAGATPDALAPALRPGGCRNGLRDADIADPRTCEWGPSDAERTAVVVGDSVALSWTPAIVEALGSGWHVIALGYASCPVGSFQSGPATGQPRFAGQCARAQERMQGFVEATRPDLTVTSSSQAYLGSLVPDDGSDRPTTWTRSVEQSLGRLAAVSGHTVLLEGTPTVVSPNACATRFAGAAPCLGATDAIFDEKRRLERAAVEALSSPGSTVAYVPTAGWICADGACPAELDGTLVRPDGTHLTGAMSARLADAMRVALVGVVDGGFGGAR